MRVYEFGKENPECILLIHPSLVTWDYFEYVIPLLEKHYHLLIPALPGYDLNDDSEFSSVEQIASELADDILKKGFVPDTVFKSFKGMDHGDMALFHPERMAQELLKL